MKTKYNEATHNRPEGDRIVDAPVVIADIPTFLKQIRKEKGFKKNDRNAITLFKTEKVSLVLVALHKKAEMNTDRPDHILNMQVLKGRVRVETNGNLYEVEAEQILSLHEKLPYKIIALGKSMILLTVIE